eukprot:855820-Rhodomonas_salina.1
MGIDDIDDITAAWVMPTIGLAMVRPVHETAAPVHGMRAFPVHGMRFPVHAMQGPPVQSMECGVLRLFSQCRIPPSVY